MNSKKPLRVLVTGATGFLGGNILKALMTQPDVQVIAACRRRDKLPRTFRGEVRIGDLMDANYRREAIKEVDVVCSAGNWASMWNHKALEHERFFEPTLDLVEQSIVNGVKRFIQTNTVVIGAADKSGKPLDDFSPTKKTGFWPHLDCLIDLDEYMRANSRRGTQMITMRLGHFIGAGNRLGMVPALVPRLRTWLVPWLAGGRKRLPLVADTDLGHAFRLASVAESLNEYESFNICGADFPTLREVVDSLLPRPASPSRCTACLTRPAMHSAG